MGHKTHYMNSVLTEEQGQRNCNIEANKDFIHHILTHVEHITARGDL